MIHLASNLDLPNEFVTQTCAILARRGAGKTYTALKMAEEMADNGLPFVIIDPTGVCWGLRSSASGKQSGWPIVILGGEHGDLPLQPTSGRVVADFVVSSGSPIILDLSDFESRSAQDRFVYEFADRLYRAKAKHRAPLHLLVDEADQFAPQRPMPDQTKMLGAWESIVRLGRSRGLGVTMITQRPAVLNKNVLTQIELLIVLQVTSPQDRAAIKAWIEGNADVDESKEVLGSLAGLQRGEAWVWSPAWLKVLQRIKVAQRSTFDSSSTPDAAGAVVQPSRVAPVDLAALSEQMAATIEEAEANNPKRLRARVAELERQLAAMEPTTVDRVVEYVTVRAPIPPIVEELVSAVASFADTVTGEAKRLVDLSVSVGDALREAGDAEPTRTPPPPERLPPRQAPPRAAAQPTARPRTEPGDVAPLRAGAWRILETMARHHPVRLTRSQIGVLAKFKVTGGTFGNYWSALKRAGYVAESAGLAWVTDEGLAAAGVDGVAPLTPDEILDQWRSSLRAGARRMLDAVIANPGMSRSELGEAVGMEPSGGTFGNYLSTLKRNNLIDEAGGGLYPADLIAGAHG